MSERWMHKPRTVNFWEARSKLVYGSKHEGWFPSEDKARAFARKEIAKSGGVGRVTAVLNCTVYYDTYAEVE